MTDTTPPIAAKKPHSSTHHGIEVSDDYAWLRDPGYPEVTDKQVLAHLEAENAWFESRMAPRKKLIDTLFTGPQIKALGRELGERVILEHVVDEIVQLAG